MKNSRELTSCEKSRIKKLVSSSCANYCKEYGCLPLDSDCYMFYVGLTSSKLCKYFEESVLPLDAELLALFKGIPTRSCQYCRKKFAAVGKKAYCSDSCKENARREQTAKRVRKHRENKAVMPRCTTHFSK